jgi:tripartite-type tricarboxylate transporter receptor subunit TctC
LIAYAKSHPGKVSYASAGVGSSPHLAMEWFAHLASVRMTHVPYNGLAQALTHVVAGHVDLMFNNTANVLPLVKERKLVALAVDGEKRLSDLDSIPALAETFPGYVMSTWFAIVAPPGTPSAIVEKVSAAIAHALREPDVRKRFSDLSATPVGSTPADTLTFIRRERERWYGIVDAAGIKVD